MIIGYARVSTQDQTSQLQRDALEEAGCEQIFEECVTGTKRERPELQACLRTLRDGDTLVVWKLDRLARSLKDLVELIHELNERGVGFRSLTEAIDTTSAGGKLVFHIFGALAEFEHSLIRERTLAGLAAARARGRKGGRRPVMSAADVRKAAAMLADPEITKTEVAKHFGVSRVTLNASLEREGLVKAVNHPKLEQLLAECDPDAPELEELRYWQGAPAVGREV
ncbi:recombinase family protein [Halomonas sp. ML-15]|uniref:recombinase family protein n=1 Tax=Halomonas sp. ML-15 TaxID=2773305 RepID=UPI0017469E8C|nr:recombinase family protein [Halomonas sp. ML-15]MBD3895989.1 recombinase family protein [Halomonas sp. ML-15]